MKHGLISTLILAAALAAAPAMAQRSVSGTIGAAHAATEAPAATETAASVEAAPAPATPAPAPAAAAPAPAPVQPSALAMTIPTPQASAPSTGGGLLQTSLALLFVIGLMLGLAWLTKRFGPKNFGGGNSNVKLVGSLSVGTRERILVVEVGEQWIVVGASPGRMNALATMPRQESSEPAQPATVPGANFADWIKQTIDKRNGK
ncbi:flagellar protein FliO/FliZ [Duganella sp. CF402]|uniref:flagellar biosynthetic protein FliO n=1 Tax=unclassified Duganella TaxID=2636909 RepID=UPI0008B40024|nr:MULTISPECIES: flagellar biosynthetic protein FliO [unclassified Duganella]RZT09016.1 flagellar protein FliO/FliZ [Duganella sp. BK701]SEL73600.1 flagellar protein FliO/FliZ [Duganella sp. CF402]